MFAVSALGKSYQLYKYIQASYKKQSQQIQSASSPKI